MDIFGRSLSRKIYLLKLQVPVGQDSAKTCLVICPSTECECSNLPSVVDCISTLLQVNGMMFSRSGDMPSDMVLEEFTFAEYPQGNPCTLQSISERVTEIVNLEDFDSGEQSEDLLDRG